MRLRSSFLLLFISLAGAMPAWAGGGADKAFAELLACDASALTRIGAFKVAFGPSAIVTRSGDKPSKPLQHFELDEATFAKPVEVHGLHLLAFVRYFVTNADHQPVALSFGFRTFETAPVVARKVGELLKDVEAQQHDDQFGWLTELEPNWHTDGDGSAIEHQHPLRMVLVSPSLPNEAHPGAALTECDIAEARIGKAPPPKLADIFIAAPSSEPGR